MSEDKPVIIKTGNPALTIILALVLSALAYHFGVQSQAESKPMHQMKLEDIPKMINIYAGQTVPIEKTKEYLIATDDGKIWRIYHRIRWETQQLN